MSVSTRPVLSCLVPMLPKVRRSCVLHLLLYLLPCDPKDGPRLLLIDGPRLFCLALVLVYFRGQ